jgi:hypothetical protein
MPKNMFKACGDNVSNVFIAASFINTINSTTYFRGDNLHIYTKFINHQATIYSQLNGWDSRR